MTVITRYRGDTYADEFTVRSKTTKQPLPIGGCSFTLTLNLKLAPTNADPNIYVLTGEIVDSLLGRVAFAPTDQQADIVGEYFYSVRMTDASGRKRTIGVDKYIYTQGIG